MSRLPDFIVIGAMKCATSTLADQLNGQEGLFITSPKEPCYFSDDDVYERGLSAYSALFDRAAPGDLVGEASTHYTKLPDYPQAIARMQEHGFAGKLIYVMRHPVDRLISHYIHAWTEKVVDCPVSEAIESHAELIDYGRYSMQIEPYLEAFGTSRVLPVFYDRLVSSPDEELNRVCDFIGLPAAAVWDHGQARQNVSADRMRTSPMRDLVINAPVLRTVRRMFPHPLRKKVKQFWQLSERPDLSEAARQRVESIFDEDLAKLGARLGVELNCANYKSVTAESTLDWKG